MRILLDKQNRKILFDNLAKKHDCKTMRELSKHLNIPFKTLQNWKYGTRYIDEKMIPKNIFQKLSYIDKKPNNWGQIKAGKKTYKIILKKYGPEEIKKRQISGGLNSRKSKSKRIEIDLEDPFILEFYGALLGDGWISHFKNKTKNTYLFGFSGDLDKDKEYHEYLQSIIAIKFSRKGYIRKKLGNTRELVFCHENLFNYFTKELSFPIGKKTNLKISNKIPLSSKNFKFILRGIFDTDGSFYLDKKYPCISIQMIAPLLMEQIYDFLKREGFKPIFRKQKNMITLKGKKQINKWVKEIGMSNSRHIKRILSWRKADNEISSL